MREVIYLTEEKRAALVDISTVHIDPNLPHAERAADYIKQIKDPCCFLCNGASRARWKDIALQIQWLVYQ